MIGHSFGVLSNAQCKRVLARNHVGRLAFMNGRVVDIEPLGYAMDGEWLFARSAPGTKLSALAGKPYAAFEVDELEGPFDWRSVVVHGTISRFTADGAPVDQRTFARAVRALRRAMPKALGKNDPVPERRIVYGLRIHQLDGRVAQSRPRSRRT